MSFSRLPIWTGVGPLLLAGTLLVGCATAPDDRSGQARATAEDKELEQFLQTAVADYRSQFSNFNTGPDLKVDVAASGKTLEFSFGFSARDSRNALGAAQFVNSVLTDYSCSNYKTKHWLEKGIEFQFRFLDRSGSLILQSIIDSDRCSAL